MDRDHLVNRSITALWPQASRPHLAELILALALKADGAPERRDIGSVGWLNDVVLTGWRAGDARCADTIFVTVGGEVDVAAALRELEARQDRYRNMISTMPFPIWQVDATAADRLIMRLVPDGAGGVGDVPAYLADHPELIDRVHDIVLVTDVNEQAMAMMGASDRSQLIGPVNTSSRPRPRRPAGCSWPTARASLPTSRRSRSPPWTAGCRTSSTW